MTINRVTEIVESLRSASSKSNNHVTAALMPEALSALLGLVGDLQKQISNLEAQLTLVRSDLQSANTVSTASSELTSKTKPRSRKILTETDKETPVEK